MKKSSVNLNDYNKVSPSGKIKMGETMVTYYRLSGNRLWYDKKAIERVLTGKNQHNILGADKDPRNHGKIFDMDRKEIVSVISKTGVSNYLKKAWSVTEERRHDYYSGVKKLENPQEKTVSEPLQIPIYNANIPVKVRNFIKISEDNGQFLVDYAVAGTTTDEKNRAVATMLITVANSILTGSHGVNLKEVA